MPKKIFAAMSGGVDSSVAAYLLTQAGYEVTGATMTLYRPEGQTGDTQDVTDARAICEKLGIPHVTYDLGEVFCRCVIEDFIRAIGAEPVVYPTRNECCGGYIALEDPAAAKKRSLSVSESAASHGAEMIVTACPLCKYNLAKNDSPIPVVYFTELLAEALGVKEA